MGVTSLWQIVQPCARPIKLETLNRKRLAVDASIWIYQFLKAVRDKEGNALRNSHVVGFFRRICKLLFFGIKPIFVFDGGAPVLKRQTIGARKSRREGRREDAVRTAGKLLAVQMQRRAEEEDAKRREEQQRRQPSEEEEAMPEDGLVYVDELQMSQQERQQNRKFKKKDAYHLPEMDTSMNDMGGPNDPRVMSLEELEAYARQFDTGEDINVYDFSKIDYDSAFFMSLPASDRYNILNAARLRSRLRMGHSKEQLDSMFPDRMAFSKFQIERVTERNELTQRLMNINGPGDDAAFGINGSGRVAGEKGREYVLVKNEGVEGGWALGVIGDEGQQEKPIDIDPSAPTAGEEDEDWEDDEAFEDVPIEGLNRLPKQAQPSAGTDVKLAKQRRAFYNSRRPGARKQAKKPKRVPQVDDPNSLFIAEEPSESEEDIQGDEEDSQDDEGGQLDETNEDEELNRAIALSLQQGHGSPGRDREDNETNRSTEMSLEEQRDHADEDNDMLDVFQQSAVEESRPIPKSSGRGIANLVNQRAHKIAPDSHETTSFGVPVPKPDSDSEDDTIDFQAALAESRKSKRKTSPPSQGRPAQPARPVPKADAAKAHSFSGPLPFEKLDLGSSLLGRKKAQQRQDEQAGGFVNPDTAGKPAKKNAEPLPPWFSGELEDDIAKQRNLEADDRQRAKDFDKRWQFQNTGGEGRLGRNDQDQVIDLDAEDDGQTNQAPEKDTIIDLENEGLTSKPEPINVDTHVEGDADQPESHPHAIVQDPELRMGDMADAVRAEPPKRIEKPDAAPESQAGPFIDDSDEEISEQPDPSSTQAQLHEQADTELASARSATPKQPLPAVSKGPPQGKSVTDEGAPEILKPSESMQQDDEDEQQLAWSESDDGAPTRSRGPQPDEALTEAEPAGGRMQEEASRSATPEMEFEDVAGLGEEFTPEPSRTASPSHKDVEAEGPVPASGLAKQESTVEGGGGMDDIPELDEFYDPEEEELLRTLAAEAEEHARFASSLNNKTQAQNVEDYERELKQLRSQQKKDRRDADEVTHIMVTECQQLLKLFGLPYVTAPMEAEAQCAELVNIGLVDGIVTDDSDCFLFGGTRIYKNMFNQAKFVECYLASDFEKEFDLTRDKLISVAHLLGSDYTEGLPGVGPVTALELIAEFGSLDAFKTWYTGVQDTSIPKSADANSAFRKKFRKQATKLFLPPAFPDPRVNAAYLEPEVDSDPEPFQWGVPDLDALRSFLMATIGWSQERTDEVLVPVIRDMNRRMDEGTQANLTRYFEGGVGVGAATSGGGSGNGQEGFAPRKRAQGSKRMGSALTRMAERAKGRKQGGGETPVEEEDGAAVVAEEGAEVGRSGRKRKTMTRRAAEGEEEEEGSDFQEQQPAKKSKKKASTSNSSRGKGKSAKERRRKIQEAA